MEREISEKDGRDGDRPEDRATRQPSMILIRQFDGGTEIVRTSRLRLVRFDGKVEDVAVPHGTPRRLAEWIVMRGGAGFIFAHILDDVAVFREVAVIEILLDGDAATIPHPWTEERAFDYLSPDTGGGP